MKVRMDNMVNDVNQLMIDVNKKANKDDIIKSAFKGGKH